jgi:hypothetical protein
MRAVRPIPALVTSSTEQPRNVNEPDVEFFGVKLKVKNERLAALFNSSVNENVVVIGRRTFDLLARADEDEGLDVLDQPQAEAD